MEWKEEFSVGIPEIDGQHRELIDCIALIEEGMASLAPQWAVDAAMERLADYIRIHFVVEESLMRIHGYPELARHAGEHLQFADRVRNLQEQSLRADVAGEIVAFIREWLHGHILTSDRDYAAYLPRAGVVRAVPPMDAAD